MITAIVTLYKPNKNVSFNLLQISKQVDKLILCDNSPTKNENFEKLFQNQEYIFFGENRGLSKAFNTILKNKKYHWKNIDKFIFFDQDTFIPDYHIQKLVSAFDYLVLNNLSVGCVGPVYYSKNEKKTVTSRFMKKTINENIFRINYMITSSLLTNYDNLQKINFWNEDFFLDLADLDLCFRLNKNNLFCYLITNSVITHELGLSSKKLFFINLLNEKPFREYYIVRESCKLILKNYTSYKLKLKLLYNITVNLFLRILFFPEKLKRMTYSVKGFLDFIKNKNTEIKI